MKRLEEEVARIGGILAEFQRSGKLTITLMMGRIWLKHSRNHNRMILFQVSAPS